MIRTLITTLVLVLTLTTVPAAPDAPPTDAERGRWTMADMRSLATAIEAYAIDHKRYPDGASFAAIVAAIEPVYMRKAPTRDAWGHDYVYAHNAAGDSYTLVSVGSDGLAAPQTWSIAGPLSGFDEDAVLTSGQFTRPWPFR